MNVFICVGVCVKEQGILFQNMIQSAYVLLCHPKLISPLISFSHTHTHTHTARLSSQTYPIVRLFSSSNFLLVNLELFEYEGDIHILYWYIVSLKHYYCFINDPITIFLDFKLHTWMIYSFNTHLNETYHYWSQNEVQK